MSKRGNGEGSIYRRKDGRWVGQYTVYTAKGAKYRYIYGKTRQTVAEKLTKAMADRDGGLIFDAGKMTVGEYLDRWLSDSVRGTVRVSTYERHEGIIRIHLGPSGTRQAQEPHPDARARSPSRETGRWARPSHGPEDPFHAPQSPLSGGTRWPDSPQPRRREGSQTRTRGDAPAL